MEITEETKTDLRVGMRHLAMAMRYLDNFDFGATRYQMNESKHYLEKVSKAIEMNGPVKWEGK